MWNNYIIQKHRIQIDKTNKPIINGRLRAANFGGCIKFGKNVKINSSAKYNQIGGDTVSRIITTQGLINIGNNVGISNSSIVSQQSIIIEDDVLIGGSCKIYDTDFHSLDYKSRMERPDPDVHTAPVYIKKGAFIGAHSIILKGITIGERSIIGAGSVVTTNVPDGEIWAGNPARFLRKLIVSTEDTRAI